MYLHRAVQSVDAVITTNKINRIKTFMLQYCFSVVRPIQIIIDVDSQVLYRSVLPLDVDWDW